jgi:hypothetical protein
LPKVRAVDEMNETELRAELVSLLAEGVMRYMQSKQFAIDHADRDFETDFETACLANRRETGGMRPEWNTFTPASSLAPPASSGNQRRQRGRNAPAHDCVGSA